MAATSVQGLSSGSLLDAGFGFASTASTDPSGSPNSGFPYDACVVSAGSSNAAGPFFIFSAPEFLVEAAVHHVVDVGVSFG
jgi:hypothetical protein